MKFQKLVSAVVLLSFLANNASPALAGFGFGGISLPSLGGAARKAGEDLALKKVSELLAKDAPVYYNAQHVFKKVKAPANFNNPEKIEVRSIDDLTKKYGPGDYYVDVVTYCSHITISHGGSNTAHTIGNAEGKDVVLLATLALRGEIAGVSRAKLQKIKWIVQAGIPLSQWLPEDRAVVEKLIPEFANQLKGDTLDQVEGEYRQLQQQLPVLPSFEQAMAKIPLGKTFLAMRQARKVLTQKGIDDRQVGKALFEVTGNPGAEEQPPVKPENSEWFQINDHVIARAIITHEVPVVGYSTTQDLAGNGTLGVNRFEFRILGGFQSKALKGNQMVAFAPNDVKVAQGLLIPVEVALMEIFYGVTEGTIVYGTGRAGAEAGRAITPATGGLILYGKGHAVQPLTMAPAFGKGGNNLNKELTPQEKEAIEKEKLPTGGDYPFQPPKNWQYPSQLPKVPVGNSGLKGFLDRFGNIWTKGSYRGYDQTGSFEWDVIPRNSGNGSHMNISPEGIRTHGDIIPMFR